MPRTSRTKAAKATAAATDETPSGADAIATDAGEQAADTATPIVDANQTPRVADESQASSKRPRTCRSCGKELPEDHEHPNCVECYTEWRQNQAARRAAPEMVPCATCQEPTPQWWPDWSSTPAKDTYCPKCRAAHKAQHGDEGNTTAPKAPKPVVQVVAKKSLREQAQERRDELEALLPKVEKDFPAFNFGMIHDFLAEGRRNFVAARYDEAISSFEAGLVNLLAVSQAHELAIVKIPEMLDILREVAQPHVGNPMCGSEFTSALTEAETKWGDAQMVARIVANNNPADVEHMLGTRLERLVSIRQRMDEMVRNIQEEEVRVANLPPVEDLMDQVRERYSGGRQGGGIHRAPRRQERKEGRRKRRIEYIDDLMAHTGVHADDEDN